MHALRVSLLAVAATAIAEAGPAEQVIIAAMRLSERPNYSWHSSVTDDARTYDIEGRTDGSGCTWVRLPMVQSIADRLGRDADVDIEAFFLTGAPPVLHTARGWQSLTELPKWARDRVDGDVVLWPVGPGGALANGDTLAASDPFAFPPPIVFHRQAPEEPRGPYSNAHFAMNAPHEELSLIVSSYAQLQVRDDLVAGTLTETGAELLLVPPGVGDIKPLAAAGVFTLQLKDGFVTRYTVRLEGILQLDRKHRVHVHQLATTHVRAIGSTRVDVPDEARRKLLR